MGEDGLPGNRVLSGYGTTVFTVMSALAQEHGAVNLGQGFPDWEGPEELRRAAADALITGPNQYPPMMGIPALREAVAHHNKRFYGLDVNPASEVMVTSGATEAICDCILGLVNPGDEVVVLEPVYDCYLPMLRLAGAVPRIVRMEPPHWGLPLDRLKAAFTPKTKAILLNSPHNPSGKVFSIEELKAIADLLQRFDAYAICDEVYEHLIFDSARHVPLMTLPGMRDRCLRIGSAGKTFSLTGWKIGYVTGSPALLGAVAKSHQFVTFTTAPNLQAAVALGLGYADAYFDGLAKEMQDKRDRLAAGLEGAGFAVLPSQGTYFLSVDLASLGWTDTDEAFCRHITTEAGVTAVPVSAFYERNGPQGFARFCFCKGDALLDEAARRLKAFFRPSA